MAGGGGDVKWPRVSCEVQAQEWQGKRHVLSGLCLEMSLGFRQLKLNCQRPYLAGWEGGQGSQLKGQCMAFMDS